jgi:hypothetical protein
VVIERLTVRGPAEASVRTGGPLEIVLAYHSLAAVEVHWGFSIWTGDHWVCVSGDYDTRTRLLDAGRGELRAMVPRLPMVAGRYSVRAVVVESATLLPLAMRGYLDGPTPLTVVDTPDLLANAQVATRQLVTLDVDWD